MKKFFYAILILTISACTAVIPPKKLPLGAWKYRLYINGMKGGTGAMSIARKNNTYVSTLSLVLKTGDMTKYSHQVAIETLEGAPVYLEIDNITEDNNKKYRLRTRTYFKGKKVRVITEKNKATVQLSHAPTIEGVFFMVQLLKKNFKIGTVINTRIYDPTVETEETIPSSIKVIGFDKQRIRGSMRSLIHLRKNISGIQTADIFINENGVTDLVIIKMLNNTLNLVRQ